MELQMSNRHLSVFICGPFLGLKHREFHREFTSAGAECLLKVLLADFIRKAGYFSECRISIDK
jgi:hypothetical protein